MHVYIFTSYLYMCVLCVYHCMYVHVCAYACMVACVHVCMCTYVCVYNFFFFLFCCMVCFSCTYMYCLIFHSKKSMHCIYVGKLIT